MPSNAELVCARVVQALLDADTPATDVCRDREDAVTREESPLYLIEALDEDTQPLGGGAPMIGGQDQDTLRFAVTAVVRGANWQATADTLRCAAHRVLATDAGLRGLLIGLRRERCEWRPASADQPFAYAAQIYLAKYRTPSLALDASL